MADDKKTKVQFYISDVDYDAGQNSIRIFGLTNDRKRIIIFDRNFKPYFYAVLAEDAEPNKVLELLKTTKLNYQGEEVKVIHVKLEERKFLTKAVKVVKVFAETPSHIPILQDAIKETYGIATRTEYDIKFFKRYLIDKGLVPLALAEATVEPSSIRFNEIDYVFEAENVKQISTDTMPALKILAFDIETLSTGPFPQPHKDPIIMISFYGSDGFKKILSWKKFKDAGSYVTFVDSEINLIEEFIKTIAAHKPDLLIGYGSDNFDFPFLQIRATKYNLNLNISWAGLPVYIGTKGRSAAKTKGFQHLDLSHFIRNIMDLQTERYKLDSVARELLGRGKLGGVDPKNIAEIWSSGDEDRLRNLAEYNLVDSELALMIAEKILPTEMQLMKLLGLPLFEINRMTYGQLVEWYCIRNAAQFGQLVPRKPKSWEVFERRKTSYEGAFVVKPKPGLYKNIHVFDFRSLYATIAASHNIGPDSVNCACCADDARAKIGNVHFCQKEKSFYATLLGDLVERRKRIGEILKTTPQDDPSHQDLIARRHALKYVAASFYGYLGFAGSRWYSVECAETITYLGRSYIQTVIKTAEKFGFDVLYGDTDSLFLTSKDEVDTNKFLDIVNSALPKPMELEHRDSFAAGLFLEAKGKSGGAKKRYALLSKSGNVVLKGLEAVRGDWSQLARKAQRTAIEQILKDGTPDRAAAFVQNLVKDVRNRKVDLKDLVIEVRLTRDLNKYASRGPHVAAGLIAAQRGSKVGAGSRVRFVVNTGAGKISDRVALEEDATLDSYDADYYIDNQVMRAVFKLFEIFNYDVSKLTAGQATLGSF